MYISYISLESANRNAGINDILMQVATGIGMNADESYLTTHCFRRGGAQFRLFISPKMDPIHGDTLVRLVKRRKRPDL